MIDDAAILEFAAKGAERPEDVEVVVLRARDWDAIRAKVRETSPALADALSDAGYEVLELSFAKMARTYEQHGMKGFLINSAGERLSDGKHVSDR